jgi:hypothetical protein
MIKGVPSRFQVLTQPRDEHILPPTPDATPPEKQEQVLPKSDFISRSAQSSLFQLPGSPFARPSILHSSSQSSGNLSMDRLFTRSSLSSQAISAHDNPPQISASLRDHEYNESHKAWVGKTSSFITVISDNSDPSGARHPLNWPQRFGEYWHIPMQPLSTGVPRNDFIVPLHQGHPLLKNFSFITQIDKAADITQSNKAANKYIEALYPSHDIRKIIIIKQPNRSDRTNQMAKAYKPQSKLADCLQKTDVATHGYPRSLVGGALSKPTAVDSKYAEYNRVFGSDVFDSERSARPVNSSTQRARSDFDQLMRDIAQS